MNADIARAVERFDLGELVSPPTAVAEAWSNDVVRVTADHGVFALKLFPAHLSADRRATLHQAHRFERQVLRRDDLLLPQPVTSPTGDWLIDVPTQDGPRLSRCHVWVDGTPASRVPQSPEFIRAAGRYLGALHGLHQPGGDSSSLPGVDTERWHRVVTSALRADLPCAPALAELTSLVDELARDVESLRSQRRPLRISHRDFDPKNAIVDQEGRLVITDWDNAGPILAEVELMVAATSFASTDEGVLQFLAAYESAGGDAGPADAEAMATEAGDLDWLLRNVEACLPSPEPHSPELVEGSASHLRTATDLINSFATDTAELRAWPERLARWST